MKTMIEQNNYLRTKLTPENREYYEKILLYLRMKGNDEGETEKALLEILTDMVEAQTLGQTAQQYFGKTPRVAADELLHELNKDKQSASKKKLSLNIFIFCLMTLFTLMHTELNLIEYLVEVFGAIIGVNILLALIGNTAFDERPWRTYVGGGMVFMSYFALVIWSGLFTRKTLLYSFDTPILWGIFGILVCYLVLSWKWPRHFSNELFYIGSLALVAALVHLPVTANFFQTNWGQVVLLIGLGILWTVRIFKK